MAGGNDVKKKLFPHFFKIILEDTLRNDKLQIPKRIVNKCGATLTTPVFLKLPCGLRWELGLTKLDDKVWIDKGWTGFFKYYSLGHGDLLVFKYEGNSQFHVLIFDQTTTEIDYPSNPNHFEKHDIDRQPHELKKEEDHSDEVFRSFSPCSKTREKSPLPCTQPHERKRTNPVDKTLSNRSHTKPKVHKDATSKFSARGSISSKLQSHKTLTNKKTCMLTTPRHMKEVMVKGKARALEIASHFQSKNPFFTIVMPPSYASARCFFRIPAKFARKYINEHQRDVILSVSNGRCWSVQYKVRHSLERSFIAEFCNGWADFAWDNSLEVGDVCTFELNMDGNAVSFKVSIARVAYDSHDHLLLNSECSYPDCFEKHDIERRSFYELKKNKEGESPEILGVKTSERSPLPCPQPHKRMKTSHGQGETQSGSSHPRSKSKFRMPICEEDAYGNVTVRPSSSRNTIASEIASINFFSTNPHFRVALQASHFKRTSSKVHVPAAFAKTYFEEGRQTVSLQVGERSWPVKLLTFPSEYKFSAGWAAFVRDNSLCPKDVLIFELIKRKSVVLKVSIFKQTG